MICGSCLMKIAWVIFPHDKCSLPISGALAMAEKISLDQEAIAREKFPFEATSSHIKAGYLKIRNKSLTYCCSV